MKTIAIIDYGMANLHSVHKAIEHVAPSVKVYVTSKADDIRQADSIVFPGQGAIRSCFAAVDARGLREALLEATKTKPFLGICLGLQSLYEYSEEGGGVPGLSVFAGRVRQFSHNGSDANGRALKVPHKGWNQVHQVRAHPLWNGVDQDSHFYFVHSYYVESTNEREVAGLPITGCDLHRWQRARIFLPCSVILRKARKWACVCLRTSCIGMVVATRAYS